MGNAIRFKHTDVGRQQGELARLKVIQCPDYGAVYILIGPKATIGRGDENDIVISDLKASRVHAELSSAAKGWMIKDRGSANGILFDGEMVREAHLKVNDTLTIGETTLEFTTADVSTTLLVAPPRSREQFQAEQKRISELQLGKKQSGTTTSGSQGTATNRKILLIGGALAAIYL